MENKHSVKLRRGKTFLLIVCLLAFLLCSVTPIYAATTDNGNYASSLRDARQIAFIPAENEDGISVGYSDGDFCNMGPNSFAVENGMVYVLDTLNSRIITVKNGRCDIIALDEISYPKHMCLIGNTVYITDHESSCMFAMNIEDNSTVKYALPKGIEADDIYMLHMNKNGALELVDHDLKVYTWGKSSWQNAYEVSCEEVDCHSYRISGGEKKATVIETGDNTLVQFIDKSSKNVMVSVYEFVPDVPVIMFERTIRIYDRDGNVIGNTVVDDEDAYSHPDDDVYESSDGSIYIMHCKTDGVYITKPNLRKSYNSKMDSITAETQEMCKHIQDNNIRGSKPPITKLTRAQVELRANSCATHVWTFDPANKNGDVHGGLILPEYEENLHTRKTFVGIPYCRGGHHTPAEFDSFIGPNYKYTAGNTNNKLDYIYNTAGLDCSGFACYAYNAPTAYWTTVDFANEDAGYYVNTVKENSTVSNTGTETETHFSNMKKMDYIVKAYNHIVLYEEWFDSSYCAVIHASRSKGKIMKANYPFKEMKGFFMKSPYSCTKTGHQYTYTSDNKTHTGTCSICGRSYSKEHSFGVYTKVNNTYHSATCKICKAAVKTKHNFNYYGNQYTHYGVCKLCGFVSSTEAHTWIQGSNGKYICSVCGKQSNVAYTPTSIDDRISNFEGLMD